MWFSCFCILPAAEAQVIWGGIVKRLLIAYFIGNISAKKISKSIHVRQKSYSKPKVGRFFETRCSLRHIFGNQILWRSNLPFKIIANLIFCWFGLKMPIHAPKRASCGTWPHKWGAVSIPLRAHPWGICVENDILTWYLMSFRSIGFFSKNSRRPQSACHAGSPPGQHWLT